MHTTSSTFPNRATPRLPAAFKLVAWSNLCAQFSEQVALAAAPLVAVLLFAAGPAETGWLQAVQTLPFLLLSLLAGVAADRLSRRHLLLGSEALRSVALVALLVLLLTGTLNLPLLAVLGFVGAVGTVCYNVAAPALIPTLVVRAQLSDANRWLELVRSVAYTAGPAVGGLIVGLTGAAGAYLLAVALSLAATGLLATLPPDAPRHYARRHVLRDLKDGAAFVTRHALLRPIFLTACLFNTAWFVLQAVFVVHAVEHLGMSAVLVGATLAVYGIGMVVGAVAAPALAARLPLGRLILVGPTAGFAAALVMLSTIWLPAAPLAGLSFFLFGAGPIVWTIATVTLRQTVTPDALLGRVSAVIMTGTFGSRPLGAALGALVAGQFGVPVCLAMAAAGFLAQVVVIGTSEVRRLRVLPAEPV